jgi:NADPH-dependent 2,4-dienoyl-CoA reductase/sulfur reductase-like enzyme
MSKKLIIIGGVAAGAKTAAKARRQDDSLEITIYTSDKHISYSGCGLPYYISNTVKDCDNLIVRTPEEFKEKHNIDIYVEQLVTKLDPDKKEIHIKCLKTGKEYTAEYDILMIATGASPFVPPIEGVNLENVYTLRSITSAAKIKEMIYAGKAKNPVIIGGGLIGMECAEAFSEQGLNVTVIELADQLIPLMDKELAQIIEEHVKARGIKVITGDGVKQIVGDEEDKVSKVITSNEEIEADLVLLSIGIRPNVQFAKEAGIELGKSGAIKVNKKMQTNIPDIYSAGDCVETYNIITDEPIYTPLGSVANKQGRVAAINITGGEEEFAGVLNTVIVKICDLNVAKVGFSEKEVKDRGYDYVVTTVIGKDKAGYHPDAKPLTIKMIANKNDHKILGCQIVGEGASDKRIDVVVTAITGGLTVKELEQVDLAYSPPYSPATDLILIAASQLVKQLARERVKS